MRGGDAAIRVLLVEDSPTQAAELKDLLESEGFVLAIARDGREGLERAGRLPLDLILADVLMPRMDGYEFCTALKADPQTSQIPVILLTSLKEPQDMVRGLECGADSFISKPYESNDLIRRIRGFLASRRLRGRGKAADTCRVRFMDEEFSIEAPREQILDYLASTFEDFVKAKEKEYQALNAQEMISRSQAQYRSLIHNAACGIFRCNASGKLQMVNAAMVRMLGYQSAEHLMEANLGSEIFVERGDLVSLLEESLEQKRVEKLDIRWHHQDGTDLLVRLSARATGEHTDDGAGIDVLVEDVSERQELEAQLRQAQKMEAVGQLTSGIAHDFNNLLTLILANSELALNSLSPTQPELQEHLREVEEAASRGQEMVKKLLGFARRQELNLKPVRLDEVLTAMSGGLKRVLPDNIEILLHTQEVGPVRADVGALEQILLNLATNARDAMPDGGSLRLELEKESLDEEFCSENPWVRPGLYACLSVVDTGAGMDRKTREKIFEPFFTTKPAGVGNGLGMAMIYGLVKDHGGFANVYSEPGNGTTVKLYFPVTEAEQKQAVGAEEVRALSGGSETVMVVDDDKGLRRAAKRALEKHGYQVLLAADGLDALETIRRLSGEVDLIITDVVMPKLGGRALYNAVRDKGQHSKFIFASGNSAIDAREMLDLGDEVPLVSKPWTVTDLVTRVREVLHG